MSHSDSELPSPRSRGHTLRESKPKHLLNYCDHDEPKEKGKKGVSTRIKEKLKSKSKSKDTRFSPLSEQNLISFSIQLPTSSKRTPFFQDDMYDDESDYTWYPPQHPKAKAQTQKDKKNTD
jgi:hypothetical protein